MAFAFALSAEIERKLISERTKEALARIKEEGKHLGRPFASKSVNKKLYPFKDEIFAELKKRASKASIAKRYNSHINSVYNFINKYKDEMQ